MTFTITITTAVISLTFGVMILLWPKSLNYAVAAWLIINGILGLLVGYYL
jgi:hypothetical protein